MGKRVDSGMQMVMSEWQIPSLLRGTQQSGMARSWFTWPATSFLRGRCRIFCAGLAYPAAIALCCSQRSLCC